MKLYFALPVCILAALAGCTTILPDNQIHVTPTHAISAENATYLGLALGVAYLVLDPLAPNWEIKEEPLADNHVRLALKMKRFYSGGAGEARVVFQRRAKELVQYGGFDGYEVVEYSEGMESSMLGSQRVCDGLIRLTGQGYGITPPVRKMSDGVPKAMQ